MANVTLYKSLLTSQVKGLTDSEYKELRKHVVSLIKAEDLKRGLKNV